MNNNNLFLTTPTTDSPSTGSSTAPMHGNPRRRWPPAPRRKPFCTFRPTTEFAIFSFDEELEWQMRMERDATPIVHIESETSSRSTSRETSRQRVPAHGSDSESHSLKSISSVESFVLHPLRKTSSNSSDAMQSNDQPAEVIGPMPILFPYRGR